MLDIRARTSNTDLTQTKTKNNSTTRNDKYKSLFWNENSERQFFLERKFRAAQPLPAAVPRQDSPRTSSPPPTSSIVRVDTPAAVWGRTTGPTSGDWANDHVEHAIDTWFHTLSPWLASQGRRGLNVLLSRPGGVTYGSLFSGSDVTGRVFDKLQSFYKHLTGRGGHVFKPLYQCEADPTKRIWLEEQFSEDRPGKFTPCKFLFEDARHLADDPKALDTKSGEFQVVPKVDILTAGFSCKSKSSLNKNRSAFRHCVEREEGDTGVSFGHTKRVVERKRPRVVILENVMDLAENSDERSDLDYIHEWLRSIGYSSQDFRMSAVAYGSPARRDRIYIVGFDDDANNHRIGLVRAMLADMENVTDPPTANTVLFTPEEEATNYIPPVVDRLFSRGDKGFDQVHEAHLNPTKS